MKRIVALVFMLGFLFSGFAQEKVLITGVVLNKKSEPLSGVSVQVKGQAVSTISQTNGVFTIALDKSMEDTPVDLVFHYAKFDPFVVRNVLPKDIVVVILDKKLKHDKAIRFKHKCYE